MTSGFIEKPDLSRVKKLNKESHESKTGIITFDSNSKLDIVVFGFDINCHNTWQN